MNPCRHTTPIEACGYCEPVWVPSTPRTDAMLATVSALFASNLLPDEPESSAA